MPIRRGTWRWPGRAHPPPAPGGAGGRRPRRGGAGAGRRFVEATRIFTLAESLGAVESLIELPAAMTHLSVVGTPMEVPPGLIRLSIGIESAEDLVADLDRAFAAVASLQRG
jgi:hypothetical protein